ncbi:hypothetical protein K493DRAFT_18267 [Basidiobolus meristosporus CBS 931.73]|uniref:Uncharacterized protein n=1 Tax=Basidiobolus meristosporus CBS 931.73 TaxID=1314790 RepID=A0A1Y1Z8M9_9FUNG|nr:hypothetical protein K493DRAFT_18267 [Basidiobolus meristosporus CBS 931.73]|eukprot:ORY06566.1 hypothetical protein K493DRAFT_18267 [Basidiobolus meristosporus CBS 931.73]
MSVTCSTIQVALAILLLLAHTVGRSEAALTLYLPNFTPSLTVENTDMTRLNTTNYHRISGTLQIAQFIPGSNCLLQDPPPNTTILLVPFRTAQQYGCGTYSDVVRLNGWMGVGNHTNHIPDVAVFTSMNGGTPGIGEYLAGSISVLSRGVPILTLVTQESMDLLVAEFQLGSYAQITEGRSRSNGNHNRNRVHAFIANQLSRSRTMGEAPEIEGTSRLYRHSEHTVCLAGPCFTQGPIHRAHVSLGSLGDRECQILCVSRDPVDLFV